MRASAEAIGEFGWLQGKNGDKAVGFCMEGAICHTLANEMRFDYTWDATYAERIIRGFGRWLYERGMIKDFDLPRVYNDAPERSKEECVLAMKLYAEHLEDGEKWKNEESARYAGGRTNTSATTPSLSYMKEGFSLLATVSATGAIPLSSYHYATSAF